MHDRRVEVEFRDIHDGDTVVNVVIDQGFRDTKEMEIRLLGVWAPELSDPGGLETKAFVEGWVTKYATPGTRWNLVCLFARMKVKDAEQKTLDRYLGTITTLDGTRTLNADVIQFVASQGYGGGTGSTSP